MKSETCYRFGTSKKGDSDKRLIHSHNSVNKSIAVRTIVSRVMPITFKSKHSPSIVMLEAVALELIRIMGHSGGVPGALAAEDIPAALERLERVVDAMPDRPLDKRSGHP
jgi:hypothetical protein